MLLFEELSMNAWPALQTMVYDGWILRFANGYTKRANSVLPLYDYQLPLNEKIDYCEEIYHRQGLPTVFKLTPSGSLIDEVLEQRGYRRVDETAIRVVSLDGWKAVENDVTVETHFNRKWVTSNFALSHITDERTLATAGQMLQNLRNKAIYVNKVVDGKVVSSGLGVMERGYVGLFDIIVEEACRQRGFGREIVTSLLNEASKSNSHHAYLQVVAGNKPAEHLYDTLGFREVYKYWYRVKG